MLSAGLVAAALYGADAPPVPLNPHDAVCPSDGILTVSTALGQTTEIDAPPGQYLFDVKGGDANSWDIAVASDASAKEPPRSLGVTPKVKGAATMIYLTTNTLQQCVIRFQEASRPFETLLRFQRADGKKETLLPEYKWVPAYQAQEYQKQAEQDRKDKEAALAGVGKKVQEGIEAYQARAPYEIKHPYVYDEAKAERLGIHGIYWIGHMTVIEGRFPSAPNVTEEFEGKPKQIDFTLHDGVYLMDTHVTNPFMIAGGLKKEHRLEVRLRGGE